MKILVKKTAPQVYLSKQSSRFSQRWLDKMKSVAGTELGVDTEFLYDDQFSTKCKIRLTADCVEKVIDDVRSFKQRCDWCGKASDKVFIACPHCKTSSHLFLFGDGDVVRPLIRKEHKHDNDVHGPPQQCTQC